MAEKLCGLENKIRYKFKDIKLLRQAMTHSSYINEKHLEKYECNERLEFLGDAVLELISSEFLYKDMPKAAEGRLTKARAEMVCEAALTFCAGKIDLGFYLLLGRGEEATGGRTRPSVISDALEALIGAIYLDGGFAAAKEFIRGFLLTDDEERRQFFDSKTVLQEMVQSGGGEGVAYKLVKEEGPDHDKTFYVEAHIGGISYGAGKGHTKKAAEQAAAYSAILKLKKDKAGTTCI